MRIILADSLLQVVTYMNAFKGSSWAKNWENGKLAWWGAETQNRWHRYRSCTDQCRWQSGCFRNPRTLVNHSLTSSRSKTQGQLDIPHRDEPGSPQDCLPHIASSFPSNIPHQSQTDGSGRTCIDPDGPIGWSDETNRPQMQARASNREREAGIGRGSRESIKNCFHLS